MNSLHDPPGPGPEESFQQSPPQATEKSSDDATAQEEETAPQLRLLREIFNGGCPPEDLPKCNFMLDSDDVDEGIAEVPAATILEHFDTVANILEAGVGTINCALSNEAWLRLHKALMANMINGISNSFMTNANESLFSTLRLMEGILVLIGIIQCEWKKYDSCAEGIFIARK